MSLYLCRRWYLLSALADSSQIFPVHLQLFSFTWSKISKKYLRICTTYYISPRLVLRNQNSCLPINFVTVFEGELKNLLVYYYNKWQPSPLHRQHNNIKILHFFNLRRCSNNNVVNSVEYEGRAPI